MARLPFPHREGGAGPTRYSFFITPKFRLYVCSVFFPQRLLVSGSWFFGRTLDFHSEYNRYVFQFNSV